jgi:hypothetical protein
MTVRRVRPPQRRDGEGVGAAVPRPGDAEGVGAAVPRPGDAEGVGAAVPRPGDAEGVGPGAGAEACVLAETGLVPAG